MTTNVTLSSLSRNTLLLLPQKNLQQAPSSNVPVKADDAVAVDKFTMSPEALARINAEKTNADALPQESGKLTLGDLGSKAAGLEVMTLQTREQLGSPSLSVAKQSQQALFRLL